VVVEDIFGEQVKAALGMLLLKYNFARVFIYG
jgi:hypothetical protein